MKHDSKTRHVLACASFCLGGVSSAFAQSAPSSSAPAPTVGVLEEVVVTALRRRQTLVEVPASVVAITGQDLHEMGARSYDDYLRAIPNVAFTETGFRRSDFVIRGVTAGASQLDGTTGIYVDEAPVSEPLVSTVDFNLFDIDRVEVLRGPQGTLYGASSMGGTIRFIQNRPDAGAFDALVDTTASSTVDGGTNYSANAMVNVPISDRFAMRGSVGYRDDSGFIDDPVRGVKNLNGSTQSTGRLVARVLASDTVSIDFGVLYQGDEYDGQNSYFESLGPFDQVHKAQEYAERDTYLYSLTVNADFGWANLVSATNYFDKTQLFTADTTNNFRAFAEAIIGGPLDPTAALLLATQVQQLGFTQEVRLASEGEGRFNWLAGVFYSDGRRETEQFFDLNLVPQLIGQAILFDQQNTVYQRQIAGFGEVNYEFHPHLTATAGIRLFDYNTSSSAQSRGTLSSSGNDNFRFTRDSTAGSDNTSKLSLAYQPNEDHTLYVSASQGYRNGQAGGVVLPAACDADLAAIGLTAPPANVAPDSLWSYELGSRNRLLAGRATLNAAAFYIDWSDIQLTRTLPCAFSFTDNYGKVESKGVELEGTVSPFDRFDLSASVGYTDAKFKTPPPGAVPGESVPGVPKWSYSASAQYAFPVTTYGDAYVRGDFRHSSSVRTGFSLSSTARVLEPVENINLRFGFRTDRWDAALFVTNAADRINETAFRNPEYSVSRPRTIGVNVRVNF